MEIQDLIRKRAVSRGTRGVRAVRIAWRAGLLFVLLLGWAASASAQKKKGNDPTTCPYCKNDPEIMQKAGIVSHGGFDFGKNNTTKIDEFLSTQDIKWIETAHFKIGFALGTQKVTLDEKKKILAELTRLHEVLPVVKPDTGILDPWLRTHLYAQRCEDIWNRFVEIMQAKDLVWADGKGGLWTGSYKGEGPYLGMRQKYEVLVLTNESAQLAFLVEHAGLPIKKSQRWHYVDRGAMSLMVHAQQGRLRVDMALHGHLAFNLAQNLYDGFNHYSYDTPVWYHEGLAHFMEREIEPEYNSFDSGEGAIAEMTSKKDWRPEVLKLIDNNGAARMAELVSLKNYSDLKLSHHFTTWAMIDYLVTVNPQGLAKFLGQMKRSYDEKGIPTGANLAEFHRKAFKESLGMSYAEFDDAWREWAKTAYKAGPPKSGDPGTVVGPGGLGPKPGGG
jgi:glutaredoxin